MSDTSMNTVARLRDLRTPQGRAWAAANGQRDASDFAHALGATSPVLDLTLPELAVCFLLVDRIRRAGDKTQRDLNLTISRFERRLTDDERAALKGAVQKAPFETIYGSVSTWSTV